MIDLLLLQHSDGADLAIENQNIKLTDKIETAVFLALTCSNRNDSGDSDTEHLQWWANFGEPVDRQFRSQFYYLATGKPVNSGNLAALEEAAVTDLIAAIPDLESVSVSARIIAPKRIELTCNILLKSGQNVTVEIEV